MAIDVIVVYEGDHLYPLSRLHLEREIEGQGFELCSILVNLNRI